jgi:two-component system NtrC family sensor kinase
VTLLLAVLALATLPLAAGAAWWLGRRRGERSSPEVEELRGQLTRRLNELFSLQELSYLLSESIQLDRIVTQVARYVTRFMDAQGALVALIDDGTPAVRVAAADGILAPLAGRRFSPADDAVIGGIGGREQLLVVEAVPDEPPPAIGGITVRGFAVVPLRSHGVTIGALAVASRPVGAFTSDDLRLMSTVATHAAIVLANARFVDQIKAGKEQWETTFDAFADGIAVLDEHGAIRRANRALASILQQPVTAVIGRDLSEELGGTDALREMLAGARQGQSPAGITIQARHRLFRITADPLRWSESANWVVALVDDVTEQKALETQLIQNEKMVAVGQLVSGVAHELNNPLTSIAGLSELLLEQPGIADRDREHLRVIQEQAERAGRLVRNLLTFARKERPGAYAPVDLNDITQRTILLIQYEVRLRAAQLETQLSPDLPLVNGDQYELQQVVLNLLTNAVHAVAGNAKGQPRRVIVTTALVGHQVVLRVADTGPGIDPAHLPNLFTPFFTTKDPGQGTGLGLSISFGIAERHGGRLSVEQTDTGAAFVLALPPVVQSGSTELPMPAPQAQRRRSGPHEGPRRRILMVDEDPAMQRVIRALFAEEHQTVATPPTAADAVRLLETGPFDLIIADPRAAVSAGEMFADVLLRRWPEHRGRTILVTGDVRPETHDWLRRTGCLHLQKPFRMGELRSAAERVWEHGDGAPDIRGAPTGAP